MKKIRFTIVLCLGILFPISILAQGPPLGVLPMKYNDSFAGSSGKSRVSSNFSFYYEKDGHSNTNGSGFYASYDNFFPGIKSGIGINVNRYFHSHSYKSDHFETRFNYVGANISATWAPKISIKGKYTISPSVNIGYSSFDIFDSESYFYENGIHNGVSGRVGILFNTTYYYVGYTVNLIDPQIIQFFYNYGFYSILQFGYTFQKVPDSKFSFTPQFALPIKSKAYPGDHNIYWPEYNLGFRYQNYLFSIISRLDISFPTGFLLGWQKNAWRVALNSDFAYYYQADLSVRYIFNLDKKSKHIFY